MDEWIGGRSENILISPFLILRTLHVTGFLCHLSSRTRAVLEVASLIWSVDRAQGCDRNHHNIQRRAHAQTLLVDETDGQVGSPHACNARSAIDPEDWVGYHRQCMHATRKKMKPLACLLVVVSYGAPAGRPAAVTCCASHGWAGISGRGACVLLGRRRRSVSVALRRLHVAIMSLSRVHDRLAHQLVRSRSCGRTGTPARLHACIMLADRSSC